MTDRHQGDVRELLELLKNGDREANDQLFRVLEGELRRVASRMMRRQPDGHTFGTTDLIDEAWMKLMSGDGSPCAGREHFLAVAARAMRSILVDHARNKNRHKRRASGKRVPLDLLVETYEARAGGSLLELDEVLEQLEGIDPQMARAVDLRSFGGLSNEDVAKTLGLSLRTFERRWRMTKAWLLEQLGLSV